MKFGMQHSYSLPGYIKRFSISIRIKFTVSFIDSMKIECGFIIITSYSKQALRMRL